MDDNLKKIVPFAKNYKFNVVANIGFNVLYALFGTLGMVFIMPVLSVLFDEKKKEIIEFLNDYYDSNAFKIYENHIILEMGENKLSGELKYILEKGFQIMGVQKEGKQLEEYYIRKVEEG